MCAHRKKGPRVHTTSAGTDTQTYVCESHALGKTLRRLHSAEGLGAGQPRIAAHLQDGNLPL